MAREIIVDSFAGGGGASLGISRAMGREVDVAINHDAAAIRMHAANHPKTKHYTEDVWKVNPREVLGEDRIGLLWASPDCKHFSRAKGSKPVEKKIRSLAWVVIKWASLPEKQRPRIIMLENVREFEDWGPLVPRFRCSCGWTGTYGQATLMRRGKSACPQCDSRKLTETDEMVPDPSRTGLTFRKFTGRLRNLGYHIEHKVLDAADFGVRTHRKRLYLVARRDGKPIKWRAPSHGNPKKIMQQDDLFGHSLKPWRQAAECIDFSLPCPSIFDRKNALADKTQVRIAAGMKRYVLSGTPFIVGVGGRMGQSNDAPVDQPHNTVTAKNDRGLVVPVLAPFGIGAGGPEYSAKPVSLEQPGGAQTTENHRAVVAPFLAPLNHGDDGKGWSRTHSCEDPMKTITGSGEKAIISPFIMPLTHPNVKGLEKPMTDPMGANTSFNEKAIIAPVLIQMGYGWREGQAPRVLDLKAPLGAAVAGGNKQALVAAWLVKHFGGQVGVSITDSLPTQTMRGTQTQLAAAHLIHLNHGKKQWASLEEPLRTQVTSNHAFLVYSFLTKFFGTSIGQPLTDPMGAALSKDHLGLVIVHVAGEPYVIVDIGMRMLTPRELARGQGFPDSYLLTGTKTSQVARIGNSVCPDMSQMLVEDNY